MSPSVSTVTFRSTFDLCDAYCLEGESARVSFAGNGVVAIHIEDVDPLNPDTSRNIGAFCDVLVDVERGSEARFFSFTRFR